MSRFSSFVEAVEAQLGDSTVPFVLGTPDRKGQHGGRRRVHWYLTGGVIQMPDQAGGREVTAGGSRAPAVYERLESIECVIFAANLDDLDVLLDNMIVAIDRVSPNHGVRFSAYDYDYDQYSQRVPTVTLTVAVKLPVTDEIKPLVTITDESHTCEIEGVE